MRKEIKHFVPSNCRVTVRADGEFYVYEKDLTGMLGPRNASARFFQVKPVAHERELVVAADPDVHVFVEFVPGIARQEILDPTPVEVPLRFQGVPSLEDDIRRFIREEVSRAAAEADYGTFEEEDDFDMDDDELPESPYELRDMQEEAPRERFSKPAKRSKEEAPPPTDPKPSKPTEKPTTSPEVAS